MGKIRVGIKMRVTPEQSKKVQEICFANGIEWGKSAGLKHLDKPFIYINLGKYLGYSDIDDEFFDKDENEEVSAELFIRTNGTCVESEIITEDNKGEQMEELKLECLVEGYEGTYFEVGQVWETRGGRKIILKDFIKDEKYPLVFDIGNTYPEEFTLKGTYFEDAKHKLDLVRLISTETAPTESTPSEEPQPKTLSEYLKENNAYESFVENCVERALRHPISFECKRDKAEDIDDYFIWANTKEGYIYWYNLQSNIPKPIIYDMNEIVFAEVDKRIAEQKPQPEFISTEEFNQMLEQKATTKYMVFVEGRSSPKKEHDSYDSAEKEAKRLSAKEIGCNVFVVEIVKTFKSKVIVEEVK